MLYWARALVGLTVMMWLCSLSGGCTRFPSLRGIGGWLGERTPGLGRAGSADGELRLDDVQLKGSHNSYHRAPRFPLSRTWRYTHSPLSVQLRQGVRQFELDVRYDDGVVRVSHLPLIDGRSNCHTLFACLQELRQWSKQNPAHLPLFVFIEPKDHLVPSQLDGRLNVVDAVITRVFPRERLIVPEDVAGDAPTLRDAVQSKGWPTIAESRGKVAFVLFGPERHERSYARDRPRLEGRMMFVAGEPEAPYTGVLTFDDVLRSRDEVERAVRQGFLVRTRADIGLRRDKRRREAALASGAQFISSDFVDPRHNWVELGEVSPVRCNPVVAPARCGRNSLSEIESVLWAGLPPLRDVTRESLPPEGVPNRGSLQSPNGLTSVRPAVR